MRKSILEEWFCLHSTDEYLGLPFEGETIRLNNNISALIIIALLSCLI